MTPGAGRRVVIAGPTGSGKSELAAGLAEAIRGEVVNFDSIQIYRGFDIGSAKPDAALRSRAPHHLFDFIDPDEELNAADYARSAERVCREIEDRDALPILVGGTGFYLRALLSGLPEMPGRDPAIRERLRGILARERGGARLHRLLGRVDPVAAAGISPADRHRLERALEVWFVSGKRISDRERPRSDRAGIEVIRIGLTIDRKELIRRLDLRVERMYEAGLVEETRSLLERYDRASRPFGAIGYAEAVKVVDGLLTLAEAKEQTRRRTRAYAKRQMTWFRAERDVHWIDAARPSGEILGDALEILDDPERRDGVRS